MKSFDFLEKGLEYLIYKLLNNLIELCNIHSSIHPFIHSSIHPFKNVGNGKLRLAFTLVELIVVITILAILGTISFISLNNFSASARDAKRLGDVRSLYTKLTLENVKGVKYEDLVEVKSTSMMQINGEDRVVAQGVVNFGAIKENRDNFLDPSTNEDYPIAFHEAGLTASLSTEARDPSVIEIATFNEEKNRAVIIGNFFPTQDGDIAGLIKNNNGEVIINDGLTLPIIGKSEETTTKPIDEVATEIYGDEGPTEKAICNEWVKQNVLPNKGEWVWVPARKEYFETDGVGTSITDDYYRREVTYESREFTCLGFAVAKYEMSYDVYTEPNSVDISGGVEYLDFNTVAYVNPTASGGIVSKSNRYPISNINQEQAIVACNSILLEQVANPKLKTHLITNNEWMTIARNIEQQTINWSGKSVGKGYLSNGLSSDQVRGCGPGNSKAIYPLLPRDRIAKTGVATGIGSDPTNCYTKRLHILSNGQTIWDMSGNLRDFVDKGNNPIGGVVFNNPEIHGNIACNTETEGSFSFSSGDGMQVCDFALDYSYDKIGPKTPNLNRNNGIGMIWSRGETTKNLAPNNVFVRGATAQGTINSGIFMLYLKANHIGTNRSFGFRCAL